MIPENLSYQKHSNRHHVYPKSRIPMQYRAGKRKLMGKWLILPNVPIVSHNALHAIFGNRTPEEQSEFLKEICSGDILKINIYTAYKELFDVLFNGNISFSGMSEILKKWDLPGSDQQKHSDKIASLFKVLNNDVKGGVPIKKFKLNNVKQKEGQ